MVALLSIIAELPYVLGQIDNGEEANFGDSTLYVWILYAGLRARFRNCQRYEWQLGY